MNYKIIVDSCGEIPAEYKNTGKFMNVPLTLDIDGYQIVDDETFDQADFLKRVAASPNCPKSACPSPEAFMKEFTGADHVYVVTLSANLSGSYNSACLAKDMYDEEPHENKVHVFNSCSASIGQTLIAIKAAECEEAGMDFEDVIAAVDKFSEGMNTYFVLDTLEMLRKNGRLSNLKSFVATALNIKPIMGATPIGTIIQKDQTRGSNKAIKKMAEIMVKEAVDTEGKILAISHCNAKARAEMLRDEILKQKAFKDVILIDTQGVSSLYAADGGVIACI